MNLAKSKVCLKPLPFDETLHQQTLLYWEVSRAWNGFSGPSGRMNIQQAIQNMNSCLANIGPHRPLFNKIADMQSNLIEYGTKASYLRKHKVANTNHIKLGDTNNVVPIQRG